MRNYAREEPDLSALFWKVPQCVEKRTASSFSAHKIYPETAVKTHVHDGVNTVTHGILCFTGQKDRNVLELNARHETENTTDDEVHLLTLNRNETAQQDNELLIHYRKSQNYTFIYELCWHSEQSQVDNLFCFS